MVKSIDLSVLGAFHIFSKNSEGKITLPENTDQDLINGVLEIVGKGYAEKRKNGTECLYCLTPKGKNYLTQIRKHIEETF